MVMHFRDFSPPQPLPPSANTCFSYSVYQIFTLFIPVFMSLDVLRSTDFSYVLSIIGNMYFILYYGIINF
jgi:hypothetical protein